MPWRPFADGETLNGRHVGEGDHIELSERGANGSTLRADSLPENYKYEDTGCDLYPSCLACPLAQCRFDVKGGAAAQLRKPRDERIMVAIAEGDSIDLVAATFGLGRRSVFRIVAAGKSPVG